MHRKPVSDPRLPNRRAAFDKNGAVCHSTSMMKMNARHAARLFVRWARLVVIGGCIAVLPAGVCSAQQSEPAAESASQTTDETIHSQTLETISSGTADSDWIRLNSGEWLKGEIRRLYEKKLEFASDELGLLQLDWESVRYVRGHGAFSVLFEESISAQGLLLVTDSKVFVTAGEDRQEFERTQLVAIVPGAVREIDYWSAKISFGLTLTEGNTKQTQWYTIANIKRRTAKTRFIVDWLGNFSETDGEETVDNQRLNYNFDVFRTRKLFLRPIFGEFFRDPFSNIKIRYTVGTGLGYLVIDTARTEWSVSGGPAYRETRFDSVQAGQNDSESTAALEVKTRFETKLTKQVDFAFRYSFQIVNKASGTYTHNLVTGLSTKLTRWLDLDLTFVWDRIQDPQPAADGIIPEQDDYYYIISLGIGF